MEAADGVVACPLAGSCQQVLPCPEGQHVRLLDRHHVEFDLMQARHMIAQQPGFAAEGSVDEDTTTEDEVQIRSACL